MALAPVPSSAALAALRPALFARLDEIGFGRDAFEEVAALGDFLPPRLRPPIRHWHLRHRPGPLPLLLRALCFSDPIPRAAAAEALGPGLAAALEEAGLLAAAGGGQLVSPFLAHCFLGLLILCDDLHGDAEAVMGAGPTTKVLAEASAPDGPIGSALDMGCGAGTLALVLARSAARVVGVDLSPRAVELARANAALNGVGNAEFRLGDLFAPVAGERFDLIVAQPPFVPKPEGARASTFLDGGVRGDELPRRFLEKVPDHLVPGGCSIALVQWPVVAGDAIEDRIAGAARDGCGVLLLRGARSPADSQAAAYAFIDDPQAGADFAERFARRRDHLRALGIEELQSSLVVIDRDGGPPFRAALDVLPFSVCQVNGARIARMLVAQRLAATGGEAVRSARVALPHGTEVREVEGGRVRLGFAEEAMVPSCELDGGAARLLVALADHDRVGDGLATLLAAAPPEVAERALAFVVRGLQSGFLEVA